LDEAVAVISGGGEGVVRDGEGFTSSMVATIWSSF